MDESKLIGIWLHFGPVDPERNGLKILTRVVPRIGETIDFNYFTKHPKINGNAVPEMGRVLDVVWTYANLDGKGYCTNIAISVTAKE